MNVHYGDDELSIYALAPSLTGDADARFHTAGVVRKLCRAAHARHELA